MSAFGKCNGGGRRSSPRERAPLTAVFMAISGTGAAIVVDLSATGTRLRSTSVPRPHEAVEVAIEGVRVFGRVSWSRDHDFGIAFETPLTVREVRLLQHHVRTMAGVKPEVKAAFDDWSIGIAR